MASQLVVDTDKLIDNVQATSCLWNPKSPNYFKRDYQRVGWLKLADDMKAPVHELKKRWRGLRDTFTRELRRLSATESSAPLEQRGQWRYFSRLLFLRNVVTVSSKNGLPPPPKRRRRCGRRTPAEDDEALERDYCDADALDDEDADADEGRSSSEGEDAADDEASAITQPQPVPVHSYRLERPESLARESSPVPAGGGPAAAAAAAAAGDDDADAQFLLSLLPFLRDVPKKRKLLVRSRLLHVLMDEQIVMQKEPHLQTH